MLWTMLVMLVVLTVAAAVVVYVAYPHRGEEVPGAPWLGEVLQRGVDALPAPLEPSLESFGIVEDREDASPRG